jgi:hypothetical protein
MANFYKTTQCHILEESSFESPQSEQMVRIQLKLSTVIALHQDKYCGEIHILLLFMRRHDNVDTQGTMSIFNVNYYKLFLLNSSFCGSAKARVQYVSIHELKCVNTQATENPINCNKQSNSPLDGWRSDMERSTFGSG